MSKAEFKIERGVKPPPGRRFSSRYPWEEMKVGDSFVGDKAAQGGAASRNHKHPETKFASLHIGNGSYRVWRIR